MMTAKIALFMSNENIKLISDEKQHNPGGIIHHHNYLIGVSFMAVD